MLVAIDGPEQQESITYLTISGIYEFGSLPMASRVHSQVQHSQTLPLEVVNCLENARFVSPMKMSGYSQNRMRTLSTDFKTSSYT